MSVEREAIEGLLAKAVAGELKEVEAARLLEVCREEPAVADRLAGLVAVERLAVLAARRDGGVFAAEVGARLGGAGGEVAGRVVRRLRRARVLRWVPVAAGMAAALVAGLFLLLGGGGVAEVVRTEAMEAADGPEAGTVVREGGRVVISSGLVELRYASGVRVLLEGPAEYEVTGEKSGFLHSGRLVAEIDGEEGRGFVIDGRSGRLVDLGTKFGVAVGETGEMEVHVLEGVVDAQAKGGGGAVLRLRENEALRLEGGKASRLLEADEGAFITQLPPDAGAGSGSVRWRFDEGGGTVAEDSGRGLGGGKADARFVSFSGDGPGPERIEGPFGGAMRFDGKDSFLESEYRGIAGSRPRTVAFWVRAPVDSSVTEGFGIINWGSAVRQGAAWQISVNPWAHEGPLGGLRIGTKDGEVIGTTDLRDGKWHHCAVVMYGDAEGKPNTATHVLLYVDGRLETCARKAVMEIDTAIGVHEGSLDHGIWMGRNLAYHSRRAAGYDGKFFRGDIDEMVIVDRALGWEDVRRLMEENVLGGE